ncbi:MAG: primosomal protein N' [Clostridia bacterium]
MIAKILINTSIKSLNKVYDYKVPEKLEESASIGKRVEVSFGRSRNSTEEGLIVKLVDEELQQESSKKYKLKEIISILDDISYINEDRLKLAKYISHLYFCNVYDALKLMLPPGTVSKNSKKSLNTKSESILKLVKSEADILSDIQIEKIKSAKHIRLLKFLLENDLVFVQDVVEGLGISKAVINTVIKNGYIVIEKIQPPKDLLNELKIEKTYPKTPTKEQKNAIDKISKYIYEEEFKECLLFGVTGSGKTEVYLQVLEKVLIQGKKAIVLVPEISLTYQTLTRFVSRFGNNVAILHSKMTISDRKKEYKRIKRGDVDIVVGARSAIFAPIENVGLVVIDEEHDPSYYSQTTPKYSTKDIARYICRKKGAMLLLGTATPEISTYYKAKTGSIELIEMMQRPGDALLPEVEIVDMKEEKVLGNKSILSGRLKEEILKNIEEGQQTMLFLNRRGYSSYLTCNECSYIFKCPNCDVSMTYHKNSGLLLCHYCSHVEKNIHECPKCLSQNISSGTVGTQKLEEQLKQIYPQITTLRMDADTTMTRDAHQKILDEFKTKNINVLIGTQMISKGHDIANVTLVGVLGIDAMLSMSDYTASEKAFSNISQVAGRAGRGHIAGRVIIQTNDTDNYILKSVAQHSYTSFYNAEIEHRKNFGYPPFLNLLLFEIIGEDLTQVKKQADILYEILYKEKSNIYKVFSPKSPYIQRINNKYRINIIMKTKLTNEFYKNIYEKLDEYNKFKKGVNMIVTVNPIFIS